MQQRTWTTPFGWRLSEDRKTASSWGLPGATGSQCARSSTSVTARRAVPTVIGRSPGSTYGRAPERTKAPPGERGLPYSGGQDSDLRPSGYEPDEQPAEHRISGHVGSEKSPFRRAIPNSLVQHLVQHPRWSSSGSALVQQPPRSLRWCCGRLLEPRSRQHRVPARRSRSRRRTAVGGEVARGRWEAREAPPRRAGLARARRQRRVAPADRASVPRSPHGASGTPSDGRADPRR